MEVKEKSAELSEQSSKEQVKPSSVKKKKNYRVVESRYLKAAKPPTPPVVGTRLESKGRGTPHYKTPSKTNKETAQENSKLEETLASKSICSSGVRISTPQRDIGLNDTPYLNCSEISSINTTLKDARNHSIQRPLRNPSIRRPLLDNNALNKKLKAVTKKCTIVSKKDNFPIIEEEKSQKLLLDVNNPTDLEIAYSQYLISNYLAIHAEKHLEIQDKDTSRLLFSLMESNKILAERVAELEMECNKIEMENEMEKLIKNQNETFCLMKDSIGCYADKSEEISNSFKDFHNQLLLKNVQIPDHSTLETNLSSISAQLTNNLEVKYATNSLFEPLNNVTIDVLNNNVAENSNLEKICHNCQDMLSLCSYQVSLALQQNKPHKNNSIQDKINILLYNW